MAANKHEAKKLTGTERVLLAEIESLKNRLRIMEEAQRLLVNSVGFLLDLQIGKYPSLPEKGMGNASACRCHAFPPSCGSLDPYPIPSDSDAS